MVSYDFLEETTLSSDIQKRKRGRPPNASKPPAQTDAPPSGTTAAPVEYDADAEENERPRKRGRPRKSIDNQITEAPRPRKRGRPSLQSAAEEEAQSASRGGENEEAMTGPRRKGARSQQDEQDEGRNSKEDAAGARPRKKRGRPSLKSAEEAQDEIEQEVADTQPAPRRKRGRPSLQGNGEQQQDEPKKFEQAPRKKRGRPSLQPSTQNDAVQTLPPKPRGRPSLQNLSPSGAQNRTIKKKRVTEPPSSKAQVSSAATDGQIGTPEAAAKKKQKRGRSSGEADSTARNNITTTDVDGANSEHSKTTRRRGPRSSQTASEDAVPPPSPPKPFPYVAPHVHRVRQSIIEEKWSPLSSASLNAAVNMLQLAHRPIIQRLAGTQQRRAHASAALRLVTSRIARKMQKGLPFPPAVMTAPRRGRRRIRNTGDDDGDDGGREAELEFERVLDARQALERQLDPALHAVDLLRREKLRVERELERDYQTLKSLEAGARSQSREQRGLLKKAHALTPGGLVTQLPGNIAELEFKHEDHPSTTSLFKDLDDDVLQPLALQLSGHMDSIQTNLQQAKGLVPQIAQSKAALQDLLLRHLESEQYEQVVLG
ncbi:kinetochore protein fta7 [Paramyrothecium foliicola]|nr:kinetochore protein fta7 [Paramyrothecium foliicola]